ncbi:hypothetical protein GCM10012320_34050 [Sinomonas cellulolyticus]|uniref:DUF4179 domain-containing protein n=1 Tax=Sinomonas cellulolyticus TaxID=2801916 RepID=A0ABS1K632_9MICC|nr:MULTISPECIES: hypothetical protein [Sinomonas]MBL0706933.1 hypothetical protein [Sinomonas cellulolyticus]GHG59817.1 hypothetical protein GCM10012320_34050 [Sinomonas sp. KCTC 49339]
MKTDHLLNKLREFDPAPAATAHPTERIRRAARLEQILADRPTETAPERRPRSRWLRWLAVPAAALTLAAAGTVLPMLTGNADEAYASWTAVPDSLSPADQAIAADACVAAGLSMTSPSLEIAERRGEWAALLYIGANSTSATCIAHVPAGASHAGEVSLARNGGKSAEPMGDQFTQNAITEFSDRWALIPNTRPHISFTVGEVGANVEGVSIRTADGETIQASVKNGHYVAWWPGHALGNKTEANGEPTADLEFSLTLTDGQQIPNAQPLKPS